MSAHPSRLEVTAIIVSYNTRELLRRAIASVVGDCAVVVVDNGSSDGSVEMVAAEFPNVRLIDNPENRGFGPANNQGLDVATTPLALLLNSDACATPGAIATLSQPFLDDPEVVAAGGRLVHPDARVQQSCCNELTLWVVFCEQTMLEKLAPSSRMLAPYWISHRILAATAAPTEVAQVMGACLMMRPVERFDDRFFLYCEDTDICRRLRRHGKILYVPGATFGHELGASTRSRWRAVAQYNRGKELFFLIHQGRLASLVCLTFDRLGAALRLVGWLVPTVLCLGLWGKGRSQVGLFARVLTAPVGGPRTPPRTGG